MTFADELAAVDRDSRDRLVEDIEDALQGHTPAEVFLATAYFLALAIARLRCDTDAVLDDMPRILRGVILNEAGTVTRQ